MAVAQANLVQLGSGSVAAGFGAVIANGITTIEAAGCAIARPRDNPGQRALSSDARAASRQCGVKRSPRPAVRR